MAEKKATAKKATETKAAAAKKTTTVKKAAAAKSVFTANAENAGFKAGDVYQALAAAGKALTVKEIAKAAKISEEETLLGLGWLFKEGKLANDGEKLSKHVFNKNASLFFTPNLEEIRAYVQQFLLKNSKSPSSLIESMDRRGYYRLNTQNNPDARQLMIEFREEQANEEKEEKPSKDLSLDLFS